MKYLAAFLLCFSVLIAHANVDSCVVHVENAFTPSGDNDDEGWEVYSNCVPESYHVRVFNRWGEQVWESKDIHEIWIGKGMTTDVYVWSMEVKFADEETRKLKGHVSLIR